MSLAIIITNLIIAMLAVISGMVIVMFVQRYPKLLEQGWKQDCQEYLKLEADTQQHYRFFSLPLPCRHCKKSFNFWQSFPLINFLRYAGRCLHCQKRLELWPLIVIAINLIATLAVYWRWGESLNTLLIWGFTWLALCLAMIDFKEDFLPDTMVFLLLWIGLIANAFGVFTRPSDAILGASVGYLAFHLLAFIVVLIFRKPEAMGQGDFKMIAAILAWLGLTQFAMSMLLMIGFMIISIAIFMWKTYGMFSLNLPLKVQLGPAFALTGWVLLMLPAVA